VTRPSVLPTLLQAAAERHARHPALMMEARHLSYGDLDALSNRIARSLQRHGIRVEDRVALWFDKSLEAIAAIWGVLKAGAAYVPIDATAPALRMATIARNCQVATLVTTSDRVAQVEEAFGQDPPMRAILLIDSNLPGESTHTPVVSWADIESESQDALSITIDPESLASVHYTSGSTGAPKGVITPHRALFAQAQWTQGAFGLSAEDRLTGYTPIQSAMSNFEIFAGAAAGATTFLVPKRIGAFPAALARSFSEQRLTVWYVVPSALVMMINRGNLAALDLSSLRMIAFAGEALPLPRLHELMELLPGVRFGQVYGRTEVKVRSFHEVKFPPREIDTRTIGRTPPDCGMFLLDEHMHPVAEGEVGELWVSGPGLMRGYWGLPQLTAEVMRMIELSDGEKVLACRTGDLVRRHADGALELVGRADEQVKIRGYRVEIGEIERVLHRHPAVARAIVIVQEDSMMGHRLRAVVMAKSGETVDEHALREHCFKTLPRYMIPELVEFRSELPLTGNGKLDRRALGAVSSTPRRSADGDE
jgi:amino acid adenylation domain-containing protein